MTVLQINAHDLAERLGLKRYTLSWRGDCPACDYTGTFSIRAGRDGRALLFCASCNDRDALAEAVARATGQERKPDRLPDRDGELQRQRNQDRAGALWRGSELAPGTPADLYLTSRGLSGLAASSALRFRADTPHPEGGRLPALLALVSGPDGTPVAVHRTFLTRDGRKTPAVPGKASLGPTWGGSIRLHDLNPHKTLVIGEGIETAASAGVLLGLPAWAALSAGNMAQGLLLPPEVRRVVIAADPDDAGRKAARDAWARWTAEGREVSIALPNGGGDFNDLLMARGATHVAR